mmetsp:Transcript_48726/g.155759  ORF Transcript_48726/g.155759 Transcript_48726/m.155759 type:complete len:490 (-) Transcript_48726:11-1480(-)
MLLPGHGHASHTLPLLSAVWLRVCTSRLASRMYKSWKPPRPVRTAAPPKTGPSHLLALLDGLCELHEVARDDCGAIGGGPGVEDGLLSALQPSRLPADCRRSDDVEGVAGDKPGAANVALSAGLEVPVGLGVRPEGRLPHVVHDDNVLEAVLQSGVLDQVGDLRARPVGERVAPVARGLQRLQPLLTVREGGQALVGNAQLLLLLCRQLHVEHLAAVVQGLLGAVAHGLVPPHASPAEGVLQLLEPPRAVELRLLGLAHRRQGLQRVGQAAQVEGRAVHVEGQRHGARHRGRGLLLLRDFLRRAHGSRRPRGHRPQRRQAQQRPGADAGGANPLVRVLCVAQVVHLDGARRAPRVDLDHRGGVPHALLGLHVQLHAGLQPRDVHGQRRAPRGAGRAGPGATSARRGRRGSGQLLRFQVCHREPKVVVRPVTDETDLDGGPGAAPGLGDGQDLRGVELAIAELGVQPRADLERHAAAAGKGRGRELYPLT